MPADRRRVRSAQRAPHRRRRGDGAPAAGSRRRGRWHRHDDAAHPVPRGPEGRARSDTGGTAARVGAAARPAACAPRARAAGRSWRRLSRAAHDRHTPGRASRRWARTSSRAPDTPSTRPTGSAGSRCTWMKPRSPARRRRVLAAACATGRTEIRHAATEPHVAELCRFLEAMGVGITGGGHVHDSSRRCRSPARRHAHALGRLHRCGQLGGDRRDHRGQRRGDRRARRRRGSVRGRPSPVGRADRTIEDGPAPGGAVAVGRRRPDHHGALAQFSERPGEPGDGAGDTSSGQHACARLDVRTAAVRPRSDERDARGPVPLRSAPDHRERSVQAARALARQPGLCGRGCRSSRRR